MKIKTRESLKNIKVFDRAGTLADKSKTGISDMNSASEQTQGYGYESETEYAGNQMDSMEDKAARSAMYGAERFGRWGVRETGKNIKHFRNRPRPDKSLKRLNAPKKAAKTAQKTLQAASKTAKTTVKVSKRAAVAAKRAAQATVKAVKVAVKATITAVKAIIAGAKALVAAIAAGGWVAVVIIVIICVVAMAAGSIYAVFYSDETSGDVQISRVVSDLNYEYTAEQEKFKSQYTFDYCVYDGNQADWSEVVAVFAVKLNLDPDNPQQVATFDKEKAEQLREVFWDMNDLSAYLEKRTVTEEYAEIQSDGSIKTIKREVVRIYLHIVSMSLSSNEIVDRYNFSTKQKETLTELLSVGNRGLWDGLLGEYNENSE